MQLIKVVLSFVLVSLPVFSADVSVKARVTQDACVYYSKQVLDVETRFVNFALPRSAEVFLKYAFGGVREMYSNGHKYLSQLDWENEKIVKMRPAGPYTYELPFKEFIEERGTSTHFDKLKFTFLVRFLGGDGYEEKGNNTPLGHFEVKIPKVSGCFTDTVKGMEKTTVTVVDKF